MGDLFDTVLGLERENLYWWQMGIRATLVFLVSLLYIRIANKRVFGKHSSFDIILGIMYGSVMSRAITGNSPFFPTLFAGLMLILLHKLLAALAYSSGKKSVLSNFIKGKPILLIRDGKLLKDTMRAHDVTENDLIETLRSNGGPVAFEKIETAHLERSGDISVVMKQD